MPLECSLDLKYITFYKSIATSENGIIKYVADNMINSHTSTLGKNMRHLTYKYDIDINDMLSFSKGKMRQKCYQKWKTGIDQSYPAHASVVKDMIGIKEERYTRILSNDECNIIIESTCTM